MPSNGGVSNFTGVFRLTSPSDRQRRVIKRNRQVVSCVPCRNRKLKCDRQQPCASCVRRHDQDACQFFAGPGSGGNAAASGSAPASSVPKRQMQSKLAMLESLVQGLVSQGELRGTPARETESREASGSSGPPFTSPAPPAAQTTVGGEHLSRDGNEVRFVGATSYQAVLECIRDLQGFVEAAGTAATPATAASRAPRQRDQGQSSLRDQLSVPQNLVTIQEVLKCLPSRAECDGILTFFFQQIYMIPVMIHSAQFQRAYESFWQQSESTSLLWTSLLFSLLSTSLFQQASKALGSGEGPNALALQRDKITEFSSMAYRCLLAGDHLRGKPYSVEATLIFGMHLVLQKRDVEPLCWYSIETAVRIAQRMGYHRDAMNLSRNSRDSGISPFDAEMRRRAWAYLEYFDVVYSFQHGVPPIIRGEDVDTQLPSNLRDEEFDEDSSALPQSRSSLDYTPVLAFIYGGRQVRLLRQAVQQALAVNPPSYGDVRILDDELRSLRKDIPPSLRYRPVRDSGFADAPDVIIRRFLIEILHLKTMCILHRRYLTMQGGLHEGSRQACRDASLRLLDLQAEFDEHSCEGGRLYEKRYMFTNPTGYHDFLLAAMCLCLDVMNVSTKDRSQEHERKIKALSKARSIWSKTAQWSKEAAHATKVLDEILSKVSQQEAIVSPAEPPPARGVERLAPSAPEKPSSDISRNDTRNSARRGNSEAPLLQPSWSAVNTNVPPEKPPNKSYSMEWSYEWLDNLGKRKDQASNGTLDSLLANGVDWNRIDSLLLDREHTTGVDIVPTSHRHESSREGWPYLTHQEPDRNDAGNSTNFRTWSREGVTIAAGFGPSSNGSTFL
ncbi:unnamed protein product [Discula destructiva]